MQTTSLGLSISLVLVGSALTACAAAQDASSPDAEEVTGQTQQALRNCSNALCEPPPQATSTPRWNNAWIGRGQLPALQLVESTFRCEGPTLHTIAGSQPGTFECWEITNCIYTTAKINTNQPPPPPEQGPICGGYTLVTRHLCPALGSYPVCDAYGICSCVR